MSNFFSRLAARSLNPVAAVQPRLASRFETDSPSPASGDAEAIVTESESSSVTKPAATSSARGILISETKTPAISNMEATDVSSRRAVEDFEEMPRNLNRVENQPQKNSGPVTEAAPNLTELSPRNGPFSKMRRRTPPAENSAVHNSFPQRSRDNFSTTSPAPPIVHVTIGRVEVRAVLPVPPAMQKKSPPANKVSLQDHLRNGGRA